jgi:hypothetical protein
MSDSTSIDSLSGPMGGSVSMGIQEKAPIQPQINNNINPSSNTLISPSDATVPFAPSQIDSDALDKVINGINKAESQGMTQLQSRDIPMNTAQITQDEQIKPNYLPNKDKKHYIEEHDTYNSMMEKKKQKEQQEDRLDIIYDEFQLPVLIMVLFFIFQLPFIQKKLMSFFPTMFLKDGHMSISGYIIKTLLFGANFYVIMKLINYSSEL